MLQMANEKFLKDNSYRSFVKLKYREQMKEKRQLRKTKRMMTINIPVYFFISNKIGL